MDEETRYALYAVIVALLAPGGAALWKTASLRGDIFENWNDRVDVTFAGLSERAGRELLTLQQEINELLVAGADGDFDPVKLVVDPSVLSARVNRFQHLIVVRSKLRRRFRRLLGLGPIMVTIAIIYLIGVLLETAYLIELVHILWVSRTGIILAFASLVAGTIATADYIYLQQRLSSAEILSSAGLSNE